ncbi:transcriptional regulator of aroF, aroG, tyrA and aromatic amino acid transport [Clostridium punense]|uniref:HTH-type transcriptional regulatory protein TyrR n=1 Tax=Clostridium punense TaxID=1054297 RepID=A0ABS4K448_9CLOT|nr:sigma 54-interacting transcriptional regulator [Clostridium punense]MBP2022571.1 transcriptional regulator of aroF, aroG, tyrA and aromatic amino acid transport [Clostridium punense]
MKRYIRFEIITEDKIGITLKILEKIYKANISLTSVEVFPTKICVKIEDIHKWKKDELIKEFYTLEEVIQVEEAELLYYEKNERKLLAVLDSVDDGIIAVNREGKVEIFNRYCEEIFGYKKESVVGNDITTLIKEDDLIHVIKNGKSYKNIEVTVKNLEEEKHYMVSGMAIKDDDGNSLGGICSLRDVNKAIEMVKVISSTEEGAFKEVIGNSRAINKVKNLATTVAKISSTVLIRGESGTGKELFAKAIHNLSNRRDNPFVAINCAALPDNLIESELFGYEKGSFTGALSNGKDGLFKQANNGTIFLDEIGELSLPLQAKLLRVLQEGVIRKIGSNKEERINIRVIAATNRNLEEMIKGKVFREDLYYRLNVIPLYIPALRERVEDIPILVMHFIEKLNHTLNKNIKGAEMEFINKLIEYPWQGNIRELQNVMERAMILCEGDTLVIENIIFDISNLSVFENTEISKSEPLKVIVERTEINEIKNALKNNRSIRSAAKALGISHTALMNKIKKYRI